MDTTMAAKPNFQKLTLTPSQIETTDIIRAKAADAAEQLLQFVPAGRERSLALTHLELAKYYANQAVALDGLDD